MEHSWNKSLSFAIHHPLEQIQTDNNKLMRNTHVSSFCTYRWIYYINGDKENIELWVAELCIWISAANIWSYMYMYFRLSYSLKFKGGYMYLHQQFKTWIEHAHLFGIRCIIRHCNSLKGGLHGSVHVQVMT